MRRLRRDARVFLLFAMTDERYFSSSSFDLFYNNVLGHGIPVVMLVLSSVVRIVRRALTKDHIHPSVAVILANLLLVPDYQVKRNNGIIWRSRQVHVTRRVPLQVARLFSTDTWRLMDREVSNEQMAGSALLIIQKSCVSMLSSTYASQVLPYSNKVNIPRRGLTQHMLHHLALAPVRKRQRPRSM